MAEKVTVEIVTELDIVTARKLGRKQAKQIGFNKVDQARITTAIGELAKNIFQYACEGKIIIERINKEGKKGVSITSIDQGPGIADVQKALEDGESYGAGLSSVKRLVDSMHIFSEEGKGTTVKVEKWLR
ncbi:anti-sigma regulatory factor [Ureibacillus sp. Re31]|uniref:Anti-sigma regulatory factor n=1 Tax=Ureibacillus galli TaxID=2762222 RepID=A0ABR8XAZ5_9BACL|nr:anti-sigma regulatory factor [Ureibacillus galli]MBD8026484.1 anti-sigma regulatory factor [Ureibacillus galli]